MSDTGASIDGVMREAYPLGMADARFWVYAREHAVGPYDEAEVARLPVFGPDLPLCPEPLLGTPEERWTRAADTPAFSRLFPPSQRTPDGAQPPKVGPWPPDPEKEAVDPLGTVQGRMDIIDRSLAATQRRVDLRREAYDRLKRELAARVAEASALEGRIREMGARMGGFLGMKEEVDQARAALAMNNRRAADLEAALARVEGELKAASALAAQAAAEARRRPRAEPPGPAAPEPRKRRQRRPASAGTSDLGLPPAESIDIPDFR